MDDDPYELAARRALPDSIAYLRAAHRAEPWPAHANYGTLAAFWRQVHDELRREGRSLQRLTLAFREDARTPDAFRRQFAPALGRHLQHLDLHHRIEDRVYFPRFRMLDPRMVAGFDLLENDHHVIHHHLEQVAHGATDLLAALEGDADRRRRAADAYADRADRLLALLTRHLDDEEDLVIPAILEHGEAAVS